MNDADKQAEGKREAVAGLLDRVRAATGSDREIDAALYCAFYNPVFPEEGRSQRMASARKYAPSYTSSLDAIMVLIKRELPDANCIGFDQDAGGVIAYVSRNDVPSGHWLKQGEAPTIPLAFCAAFLSAILARLETKSQERAG